MIVGMENLIQDLGFILRVMRRSGCGHRDMAPFGSSIYLSAFRFPARDSGEPIMARALEYGVTPGYAEALGLRLQE